MASEQWIPVEGVHELPLVQALAEQVRRFIKPLRYDARCAASFANVLLLDAGPAPRALHVFSPFMSPRERAAKELAVRGAGEAWVWSTDQAMPELPGVVR